MVIGDELSLITPSVTVNCWFRQTMLRVCLLCSLHCGPGNTTSKWTTHISQTIRLTFSQIWDCHSHRYPWHASCSIEWNFSSPCDRVSNILETQMKVKSPDVANISKMPTLHQHKLNKWTNNNQSRSHKNQYFLNSKPKAWEGDKMCPNVSETCPKMPCGQKCLYKVKYRIRVLLVWIPLNKL